MDVGGDMTGAHSVHGCKWKAHRTGGPMKVDEIGHLRMCPGVYVSKPREVAEIIEKAAASSN